MHATEKNRISTCSTDNGSVDAHGSARLVPVVSNQSTNSFEPKKAESVSPISVSTQDAADPESQPQTSPHMRNTSHSSAAASPSHTENMPASAAVHLSTLLVSGQRKTWKFGPSDSVDLVRNHIWNHWPESWPQPKPESSAYLRLLHLGHILDNPDLTLASRGCKPGTTTVVHIIIRSLPPSEPAKVEQESPVKTAAEPRQARRSREQEDTPGCSCVIC